MLLTSIYNLLIGPLVLLFEFIYSMAHKLTENPGLSIIALSLAMNFLVLPLYRRADAMQEEERQTAARLQPGVAQIKKAFKGDERFMMLQTFYRQNNYKPYYALKGSLSLLLEIPFFIAAYRFLSSLPLLNGVQFGLIRDLGAPDALFHIGSFAVNVLPILMTVINIVSGIIYTRGMPLKSKIQLYGMALIFLVLLYQSPAGLVFYWTLNNIFSLLKNVFYKLKNPGLILSILFSVCGIALAAFAIPHAGTLKQKIAYGAIAYLLQYPLIIVLIKRARDKKGKHIQWKEATKTDKTIFYASCVLLALITGLFIPSSVIAASPAEFIDIRAFSSPVHYLVNSFTLSLGLFVVWMAVFYQLVSPRAKRIYSIVTFVVAVCAVINHMFFGKLYGTLSPELAYSTRLQYIGRNNIILNCIVLYVAIIVFAILVKKLPSLVSSVAIAGCAALFAMSILNVTAINREVHKIEKTTDFETVSQSASWNLSKNGKNVIVLMMDRAVSAYFPYLIEEKPELKEQFAGFTYYPNTISYGMHTNLGSPALYGGYEYTPEEMNRRADKSLEEKQNEALKVMPINFLKNDYEVTVCDPTYAGYGWIPDLSIYDDYPEINTYITMGADTKDWYAENVKEGVYDEVLSRNFFCYGVFRISPVALHKFMYDRARYHDLTNGSVFTQSNSGKSKAVGYRHDFIDAYSTLSAYCEKTNITDSDQNTFLMMSNDTTHDPMLLQEPDYVPAETVDNTSYDEAHKIRYKADGTGFEIQNYTEMAYYQVDMCALMQLGKWFDYMRENGVYDNTKIIISADHGYSLNRLLNCDKDDVCNPVRYNPLYLVKDFGSTELTIDETFMTNGDTPTLAFKDLIENPTNPSTGKPISNEKKLEETQYICDSLYDTLRNNGNTYSSPTWIELKNSNILDCNNLQIIGKGVLPESAK